MTKEQVYIQQLREMGIYREAFDPLIKELAQAERQRTRAQKAWSATAPPGGKPSFLDDHWEIIQKLDQRILGYREALGLTPKALRRLMGSPEPPAQQDLITERLNAIAERVNAYEAPVFNFNTKDGPSKSSAPAETADE